MQSSNNLTFLTQYKTWADNIFYEAISQLPDKELTRERPMLFGNILSLLNHVYAMDKVWKSHLAGAPHNLQTRNPECLSSFATLRTDQVSINQWYQHYTDTLGLNKHSEIVNFTCIGAGEGQMRRFEIIQHVVNHASYHRGHIEGVLYQMSVEPPTTDIPVFLSQINR